MKTTITQFLCAALIGFGLAACTSPVSEVEPRDAFVGAYSFQATGNVDLFAGGMKLISLPLDQNGNFKIDKYGDNSKVVITGYNDSIFAFVDGNELILESNTYKAAYGDFDIKLTFTYGKAVLDSTRLTWDTEVSGVGQYSSYTVTGNGTVTVSATKQ